jgi:hypothetical protein
MRHSIRRLASKPGPYVAQFVPHAGKDPTRKPESHMKLQKEEKTREILCFMSSGDANMQLSTTLKAVFSFVKLDANNSLSMIFWQLLQAYSNCLND